MENQKRGVVPDNLKQPILDKLKEKLKENGCEMCGHKHWTLNSALASPLFLTFEESAENPVGLDFTQSHPCVVLQCQNCGNTKFLSLHILGVHENKWGGA